MKSTPTERTRGAVALALEPRRTWGPWLRTVALAGALALMAAFVTAACGDDDDDTNTASAAESNGASATTVKVTEADGTITLASASSPSGKVQFDIHNGGKLTHEFVVLKTDLAEDKLPLKADGSSVDESGSGVSEIDEQESIAPGSDAQLAFDDLASGKYVLICNVPGHYGLGMHAAFTVS